MEEEITGQGPGGWLRVCQGNKEGRSVLGTVDSTCEGMGGWRMWHTWDIGRLSVRLDKREGTVGGAGGSGWFCSAGRGGPEALIIPTVP